MEKNLSHFLYEKPYQTRKYTTPGSGGGKLKISQRENKEIHSAKLYEQFKDAWNKSEENKKAIGITELKGVYIEFICNEAYGLDIKSLENLPKGIRILRISRYSENSEELVKIIVFIPKEQRSFFLNRINDYIKKFKDKDKLRNKALVESIETIQLAVLESFWTKDSTYLNDQDSIWCEAWIRTSNDEIEQIKANFLIDLNKLEIEYLEGVLDFTERTVYLIKANKKQLKHLIELNEYIAEFNLAYEITDFIYNQDNTTQSKYVESIFSRLSINADSKVSIIILDTGINNGHKLLSKLLLDSDCHAIYPEWGSEDHCGHGTQMAGLCGYGDLEKILLSKETIKINHKLESFKILPPMGENNKRLYGYITRQAIYEKESIAPDINRIVCMAVASNECDDGHPTSWSSAIDEVAYDINKLILLPAGNIDQNEIKKYPSCNTEKPIKNPGQSWNALTVGAYTEKDKIIDQKYKNYIPLAKSGEISPSSRTSFAWFKDKKNDWPIKPDIVFEGGNYCKDENGVIWKNENLHLLTTNKNPQEYQFASISDTSAATALASRMASQIQVKYPKFWSETIRALIVHSADWTEELKQQFGVNIKSRKQALASLLRICGYGVPNLDKALYSASNHLNLIIQREIQPYILEEGNDPKTNEMHLYELPWPKEVLTELGETEIILKITLSYFIEPSPGEIGWQDRYRYASFGLRFKINRPTENKNAFFIRINKADRIEKYKDAGKDEWYLGENQRNFGSIHSDIWRGTAAELANQNLIAIFPVIGWWKERKYLGKCNSKARYSLVVSLESPEIEVDLYNLVLAKIKAEQEVVTEVPVNF